MKLSLKHTLFVFLSILFSSCSDESEDLTLKEILNQKLLETSWSVELYSIDNLDENITSGDYKVTFSDDQQLKFTNGSTIEGRWGLVYDSSIEHYDELDTQYIDYSDSIVWDDAYEDQLLLQVILNEKNFAPLTGYWTVNSYDNNSINLQNDFYVLALHEITYTD